RMRLPVGPVSSRLRRRHNTSDPTAMTAATPTSASIRCFISYPSRNSTTFSDALTRQATKPGLPSDFGVGVFWATQDRRYPTLAHAGCDEFLWRTVVRHETPARGHGRRRRHETTKSDLCMANY